MTNPNTHNPDAKGVKCVLLGQSMAGKTSLLLQYTTSKFASSEHTVSAAFSTVDFISETGKTRKYGVWDCAGEERYFAISSFFVRGSMGAFLVFDLTDRKSFIHLPRLIEKIKNDAEENCQIVVIGNKIDLIQNGTMMRDVETKEAQVFAKSVGAIGYFETSAKSSENVKEAFDCLFEHIIDTPIPVESNDMDIHATSTPTQTSSSLCCK